MLERIKKQTPQQTFQTLVKIGVYTPDGKLTPHYAPPKRRPKRKSKSKS